MQGNNRRICLIIPSLGPGGMQRVMSILANKFSNKKDSEIHLIMYGRKCELFYEVPDVIFVHKPDFEFKNSFRTYYSIKTLWYLRKKVKSLKPDTILSFGEYWNNFVLLSLLGLDFPVTVADRAEPGLKGKKIHSLLSKWLYPKSNGIIVQTEKAKEIYKKKYHHKNIVSINNPIRKIEENSIVKNREKIVLSVGRLVDTKHFDLLIEIFAKINMTSWKLIIVGGDSQQQNVFNELQSLIKKKGLEDSVELTGLVSNVNEYYLKSSIFAFTSSSEGFPNVIGEAMSAGLPIVSFDCVAGPSEMVTDRENGYLIPLFDTKSFERKLKILMENKGLRAKMGDKSKELAGRFSVEKITDEYYSFITERV